MSLIVVQVPRDTAALFPIAKMGPRSTWTVVTIQLKVVPKNKLLRRFLYVRIGHYNPISVLHKYIKHPLNITIVINCHDCDMEYNVLNSAIQWSEISCSLALFAAIHDPAHLITTLHGCMLIAQSHEYILQSHTGADPENK